MENIHLIGTSIKELILLYLPDGLIWVPFTVYFFAKERQAMKLSFQERKLS